MQEIIHGKIEKIIFRNNESYYTIATFNSDENGVITVVGNLYQISAGDKLELTGSFYHHPNYGEQFKIQSYKTYLPDTIGGIESYLASTLLKGIGHQLAKRIVDKFGTETFNILDYKIVEIKTIPGIGKKRFEFISKTWNRLKDSREAIIYLQNLGLSINSALKIYKEFGSKTKNKIEQNPYALINLIDGIGFITADRIAYHAGFEEDSIERIKAATVYQLLLLANNGNACYPQNKLIGLVSKMLKMDIDKIEEAIYALEKERSIKIESVTDNNFSMNEFVYIYSLYLIEKSISKILLNLHNARKNSIRINDKLIPETVKKQKFELSNEQINALQAVLENKITVITGGPGTGKTTIIKTIIDIFESQELKVSLCAPTGRAAKRISQTTRRTAKTIHRLLEYNPMEGLFNKNSENPLNTNLVIVDEASMIDMNLFYNLLDALPENCYLLLVGDVNQIPPIGPGNILRDIIDSGKIKTIIFNKIYRQAEGSEIILNAHRINKGEFPLVSNQKEDDFFFLKYFSENDALNEIVKLCTKILPGKLSYDPLNDVQVISPMYKGKVGVDNLNSRLQAAINPNGEEIKILSNKFRVGDKVMQIRNNYEKDIFNGDIGKIVNYDKGKRIVYINFDGKLLKYEFTEMEEITLAYAISVHKSQGSEYSVVIIPIFRSHSIMLQRNLLYTAVTRGKEKVYLIGDEQAISKALRNTKSEERNTLLKERLQLVVKV